MRTPRTASFHPKEQRRRQTDSQRGDREQVTDQKQGEAEERWMVPEEMSGLGPPGYQRSEESILEDVVEGLTQHDQIDASQIEVQLTEDGVWLIGTVRSAREKRLAEEVAATIPGVFDVHNRLEVRGEP